MHRSSSSGCTGNDGANASGRPFSDDYADLLCDAAQVRLRVEADVGRRRRWPGLLGAHHQREMPSAANKPLPAEIRNCNDFPPRTWRKAPGSAILALGTVAHEASLRALACAASSAAHGVEHALPADCVCSTAIIAAATTPTRAALPPRCSAVFARIATHLGTYSPVAA
jgi:uracil-DNA glycosylase